MARSPSGAQLAKNGPDRPVCRVEHQTADIMPNRRVCQSEAQWQAIDAQNEHAATQALQNSGRMTTPLGTSR
ncbi:hypothetical protein EAH79_10790 [Sphingomonas koreensis]|nr:hypothetical protein EAH79_10790 [Sphingomonas koreensis]